MAAPSLGEILSVRPEPNVATGTPAVVIDNSRTVDLLNQNARFKAQNDWNKYLNFQNNFKESLKDLSTIQGLETLSEDKPALKQKATEIYDVILKNPDAFSGKNPQAYAQIEKAVGELYATSTASKQDNAYDLAHREYINRNPELNTDENKSTIDSFRKAPLGKRTPYLLNMPTIFDTGKYSQDALVNSTTPFAGQPQLVGANGEPGDQFIREFSGKKLSKNQFLDYWNGGLDIQTDKFGHSIKGAVVDMFKQLPSQQQSQYKDYKDWWAKQGEAKFNSLPGEPDANGIKTIIEKDDYQANPNYVNPQELALKKATVAQGWARIGLDKAKLDKENDADVVGADSVIREAVSIIDKGSPVTVEDYDGKGGKKQMVEVAEPTLLQTFGNIDKDGKTTNVPDVVQYDKDKGQLNLIYYQKDENGSIKKVNGKRQVVDRKPLDERTWLKTIAKRSNPNKDLGTVNSLVDQVLTKSGNSLFKVSELYKGNTPEAVEVTLTGDENPSTLQVDKVYILDGKKVKWNGKQLVKQK